VGEGVTQDEIDSAVTYKLADRKSHPVAGSLVEVRAADRDWTIVRGRVVAWHDDVLTGSTRQLTISREQAVQ
jgi:hypothetical protein